MSARHRIYFSHPYRGLWAAVGTMHKKDRAIAPPLCNWFDMSVTAVPGLDTDALGTFTGDVPRAGTMLEAARAKTQLAIQKTGAPLGIGSEGAFGPDPHLPFLAAGREFILLRDAISGQEVAVSQTTRTNFAAVELAPGDDFDSFLRQINCPEHAVVVRPREAADRGLIFKGLISRLEIEKAVRTVASRSLDGRALLQTDMRAHLNPTRMAAIGHVAKWLAWRIARLCPHCRAPGFGLTDVKRGLPCADRGAPTQIIRAEVHTCKSCGHTVRKFERSQRVRAEAKWCDLCNP